MGICALQQSTQEAEEALTQGLEALNQSVSDIITSDSLSCPPNMTNYMGQMAVAINKLSTLEGFVRQVCTPSYILLLLWYYYGLIFYVLVDPPSPITIIITTCVGKKSG